MITLIMILVLGIWANAPLIMIFVLGIWVNAPWWFWGIWALAATGEILFGGRNK